MFSYEIGHRSTISFIRGIWTLGSVRTGTGSLSLASLAPTSTQNDKDTVGDL